MDYRLGHKTGHKLSPGSFYPQGATPDVGGVNFALYSQHANAVFLLLFDSPQGQPTDIISMEQRTRRVWHVYVHGLKASQLYAYKVQGPFDPRTGLRFNDAKLLVDPYAKALTDKLQNKDNLLLAYNPLAQGKDLTLDTRDNTEIVPKCVVVDDAFDWQGDVRPDIPLEKTFIYETHLKGFTAHASSHVKHPGTYLGFSEKIPYLKDLGVTAVEFLPLHEYFVDDFLRALGLTNYWGYNTIGFFSPEASYRADSAPGSQTREFKMMVRELHRAGIEVFLDVVYNHTAEGNELGPTMSFKGIDNSTYYLLTQYPTEGQRYYMNYTGCGNSLNVMNPQVIRLVMDSLRYWVEIMHVDGFRFDLASVLGREEGRFQGSASFFDTISQDPLLSRVKLIAEPWDLGTYEVGNFPVDWSEWNGRFRDTLRKFGKGLLGQVGELGSRLTGSADLYGDDGRAPFNSINFITCHDGFTLCDLLSYNQKHNDANGENNQDGANDNNSWNCGIEGPTDDPEVVRLRLKLAKNHACALLFSLGTPMILGGDEFLRTQRGNNNAYCQDNEISWHNWDDLCRNMESYDFFRKSIALNRQCTILHQRRFRCGQDGESGSACDITWYGPDGNPPRWQDPENQTLCYQLDGSREPSELGNYRLFFIFNADHHPMDIKLPCPPADLRWYRLIDTSLPAGQDFADPGQEILLNPQDQYLASPRSTIILLGRHQ